MTDVLSFFISHLFRTQSFPVIHHCCTPTVAASVGPSLCVRRVFGKYNHLSLSVLHGFTIISLCAERLLGTVRSHSAVHFKGTAKTDGFVFLTHIHTITERDDQTLLYWRMSEHNKH